MRSHRQAIELRPSYAEAYNYLGITLQTFGNLAQAEAVYRQALQLKPDYVEAYANLGITLNGLGRLEEAAASYRQALELKPDYAEVRLNLSENYDSMNNFDEAILELENILKINVGTCVLKAGVELAIFRFLDDDFTTSKKHLLASSKIQELLDLEFQNYIIFWAYLLQILSWHENKYQTNIDFITSKKLYVIGESHTLVSHGLSVQTSSDAFLCKAMLIKGCKQWNLGNSISNQFKTKFERIFHSIPKSSEVLLAIGEIDCRSDSGIIKHSKKSPEKNLNELISTTVENYLNYIHNLNSSCSHKITIQGVPCSNIDTSNIPKEQVKELISLIRDFNICLKNKSIELAYSFLDVYTLTDRGDGLSNSIWHLDDIHLTPEAMLEAWRLHLLTN